MHDLLYNYLSLSFVQSYVPLLLIRYLILHCLLQMFIQLPPRDRCRKDADAEVLLSLLAARYRFTWRQLPHIFHIILLLSSFVIFLIYIIYVYTNTCIYHIVICKASDNGLLLTLTDMLLYIAVISSTATTFQLDMQVFYNILIANVSKFLHYKQLF
jgi:hypothetical protein